MLSKHVIEIDVFHVVLDFRLKHSLIFPHLNKNVNKFPRYIQRDATFLDLFVSTDALHVSGGSSAIHQEHKNCPYSFRYCQPILLLAAIVDEMELRGVPSHPR